MKIHMGWHHNTFKLYSGYREEDRYILKYNGGYCNPEKTIVSIGSHGVKPRVDIYFPLGSNISIDKIDLINQEPISRTILCSSQYKLDNDRPYITAEYIDQFEYEYFQIPYLRNLKSSMYCLSPHGMEPDCFRHWEAMYMGCIPITLKHERLKDFYDLPILFLDSWDELTEELLLSKYEELLPRFNSEKLEEEYWVNLLETL